MPAHSAMELVASRLTGDGSIAQVEERPVEARKVRWFDPSWDHKQSRPDC